MEKAGAILVGKTNSPVMGLRGADRQLPVRADAQPVGHDAQRRRLVGRQRGGGRRRNAPIAEGTDAGGSIRIPAAWCGVYGYKASYGRVPVVIRPNAFAGDLPFVFEGPITRTVEDAALAMSVLDGYDPRDPHSLDEKVDYVGADARSIARHADRLQPGSRRFPVDPRIAAVVAKAVRAFEEAGAHVEEVKVGIKTPSVN